MRVNLIDFNRLSDLNKNLYQKIYKSSHDEFNKFIEELLALNKNIFLVISHPLLSRNNYLSSFYEDFCFLKLVIEIFNNNEKLIIKLTSYRQLLLFKRFFKKKTNIEYEYPKPNILKNIFRQLIVFFKMFVYLLYMKIISFFIYENKNKTLSLISINLIDSMFLDNNFKDRYYNGIDKEIENKQIFFYPIFLIKKNILKKIKIINKTKYKIIYTFKYIKLLDILKIQFYFLNFLKINLECKNSYFKDYLHFCFFEKLIDSNTYLSFINYYSIKSLYISKFTINQMIVWYENQPLEKALIFALNKYYPQCLLKGYKSYFVDNNFHFYLRPTNYEYLNNYVPKSILSVSYDDQKDLIKYCEHIKISAGPLLRFNNLLNRKTICKKNNYKILVSLPIHLDESIFILKLINKISKIDKNYFFLVKPHPFLKLNLLTNYLKLSNVILTDKSNEDLFYECFSIISNTSSIILEAFLAGLDVVVSTYKRIIIQNPIHFLDESYYLETDDPHEVLFHYKNFIPNSKDIIIKEKVKIDDFTKNKLLL